MRLIIVARNSRELSLLTVSEFVRFLSFRGAMISI